MLLLQCPSSLPVPKPENKCCAKYLQEHPHFALFEDGKLRYEIYRQYVGDAAAFDVQLTRNARSHTSSLDNMGAVVTVFEY